MTLEVARKIYDDVCISKTVYSLSKNYTFIRTLKDDIELIDITARDGKNIPENFEYNFFDVLNDYKLRGIIEERTKDIRTLLYAKAFMNDESEE